MMANDVAMDDVRYWTQQHQQLFLPALASSLHGSVSAAPRGHQEKTLTQAEIGENVLARRAWPGHDGMAAPSAG
ncbi:MULTISPECIES: hypothetical protein [unclassified Janthinobacterium]|uniref:hypothetical protein n=1 Tax=unclassified Janthinobacterium TaxID=2610881 RepID=UPI0018C938B7|nr:hypothetical protein [Janthinobacterium sp. CG_23.4]MDH6160165.1 hypothetical protein [Janthinobacterium sp. CG_23.4]